MPDAGIRGTLIINTQWFVHLDRGLSAWVPGCLALSMPQVSTISHALQLSKPNSRYWLILS